MTTGVNSQVAFNQTFEKLEKGANLLKLKKGKFSTWGKSTWSVTEAEGKGFNNSNKFASCGATENATLVQYKTLEAGATYVFSVAVKMTDVDGANWKGNYSIKVLSGAKSSTHFYGKEEIKEPKAGVWKEHKIKFTVEEGKENVCFQVYRWKEGVTLNVDNFKLLKK